ncbi:hypothetical protein M2347_002897 [Chryseobacterium sp. H1D6B]|uniref:hypothetical protein n=1 Tax=Chryseobacterium sp. H1D6B TaxID=2940588 RepID=UPI0015C9F937|nr:hypothetical protein [Chryseobacterium sp. H1D6B]MDH6253170.1 hypothetical protein [Chryseobacterium sp. H1D6B]
MKKIEIKNKTNWFVTILLTPALLFLILVLFLIIPLISIQDTYLLSAVIYLWSSIPFAGLFILLLHIWLWNTFGKTILNIDSEKLIIHKKYRIFGKTKVFNRTAIEKVEVKDFKIEKFKYNSKYHYSHSNSTYSVVIIYNNQAVRIVNWIQSEKAEEIRNIIIQSNPL